LTPPLTADQLRRAAQVCRLRAAGLEFVGDVRRDGRPSEAAELRELAAALDAEASAIDTE